MCWLKVGSLKTSTNGQQQCEGNNSMEEIFPNFFMITLPMPFRLMHVNIFIMIHDDKITLFDTGLNTPENFLIFEKSLRHVNKKVQDIESIFITHLHVDHCGMAGWIKDISGAEIYTSEFGRPFIARANEPAFTDTLKVFCLSNGLPEETTENIAKFFLNLKEAPVPFQIDRYYQYNQSYGIGGREFEAIPTPGHTRDHVSFFFPKEHILLSGDHVLPEISPNIGPDLSAPDFHPLQSFLESLLRVGRLPVKKVCPAHGSPFSNLTGRINELKDHHQVRMDLTYKSVKMGTKNAFEISQDIFGSALPEFDQFLALNETYVHLSQLVREGAIGEVMDKNQIFYIPIDRD